MFKAPYILPNSFSIKINEWEFLILALETAPKPTSIKNQTFKWIQKILILIYVIFRIKSKWGILLRDFQVHQKIPKCNGHFSNGNENILQHLFFSSFSSIYLKVAFLIRSLSDVRSDNHMPLLFSSHQQTMKQTRSTPPRSSRKLVRHAVGSESKTMCLSKWKRSLHLKSRRRCPGGYAQPTIASGLKSNLVSLQTIGPPVYRAERRRRNRRISRSPPPPYKKEVFNAGKKPVSKLDERSNDCSHTADSLLSNVKALPPREPLAGTNCGASPGIVGELCAAIDTDLISMNTSLSRRFDESEMDEMITHHVSPLRPKRFCLDCGPTIRTRCPIPDHPTLQAELDNKFYAEEAEIQSGDSEQSGGRKALEDGVMLVIWYKVQ